jgi:hypothetical protein
VRPLTAAAAVDASPNPWIGRLNDAPPTPDRPDSRVLFARRIARRNFAGFPFWVSCPP